MIHSKREFREYIDADRRMLGTSRLKGVTGKYLLWLRKQYFVAINYMETIREMIALWGKPSIRFP